MPSTTPPTHSLTHAVPTDRDSAAFAEMTEIASRGMFAQLLGSSRATSYLRSIFMEPDHDFSYQQVMFSELNDRITGMTCSYSALEHEEGSRELVRLALRHAGTALPRLAVMGLAGRSLFSFMDELDAGDFYLQTVAVSPEYRGHGIGSQLLANIQSQAQSSGSKQLALDVDVTNEHAIAVYQHQGWRIIRSSRPASSLLDKAQVHRMTKSL